MELVNKAARILRTEYRFGGYIHLKIIPGASQEAIDDGRKVRRQGQRKRGIRHAKALESLPQKEVQGILTDEKDR